MDRRWMRRLAWIIPTPEPSSCPVDRDLEMNAPIEFESARHYSIPAQSRSLLKPPRSLPGESQTDYATVRQMMIDEVAPQTSIEWLWTIDLIEL
jgi:hypothetical protein